MSNIVAFGNAQVPAHIAARFSDAGINSELSSGITGGFPVISYKGKVWHISEGGTRTMVADKDSGDPVLSLEVVLLKANSGLSKIYYESGYEEGSTEKPTCYSHDGVVPALDALEKQADKCAICPHNAWGSRVTDNGAKGKACSDSKRMAVAPAYDLERPMLLRVPAGSLRDLSKYAEELTKRGMPYSALVTKIGFDHSVAHPKLTFTPVRWLEEAELDTVQDVIGREMVSNILGTEVGYMPPTPASEFDALGTPPVAEKAPAAPAAKPRAAPKPKPVVTEDEIDAALAGDTAPAAEPEPVAEVKAAPAKKAETTIIDEADAALDELLAGLDDD